MKTLFSAMVLSTGLACSAAAEGLILFNNSSSTLILNASGNPIQPASVHEYIFGVFLAPASTVSGSGVAVALNNPAFQIAAAYNTNHFSLAGRLSARGSVDVGTPTGFGAGDVVDFVVRGWSSNLGYTWAEALNNMPIMAPGTFEIGTSVVGNDLLLGGGIFPLSPLFGGTSYQVPGFTLVPEPSTLTLGLFGMLALRFRTGLVTRFNPRSSNPENAGRS